jgi:glutaminyl-tRNA synthetase
MTLIKFRFTADSINNFCDTIGVTRRGNENVVSMTVLENFVISDLDLKASRTMAVLNPLKVKLINFENNETIETPLFPKDQSKGTRTIKLENIIYIDHKDFREIDDPDYFGLAPGKEVGLKYAGLITCTKVIKNDEGKIEELECTYKKETKKVKGRLHWIGHCEGVRVTCRMYHPLFKTEEVDAKDFLKDLNPNSLEVLDKALVHKSVANSSLKHLDHFQFERVGYFVVDFDTNANANRFVFNLTIMNN